MCAVGVFAGHPARERSWERRVWKTRRSQDAVPAQAAPWGEIRRQPPRTEPKPRKNAVSVGVKCISIPDLHPLYQEVTNSARGPTPRPGPFHAGRLAARRPCRAPLWFDRIGLARANRFRSVKLLCLAFRSGSSGSGPTLATRSGRGSPAPYRRSGGPTLAGPRGGGKPGPTVPLSTGRPPRRGLETRKRLLVLRAVRSPGGGSPAIPTGPGQARRPRHGGSSERPGQRLAAAYQPDRIPLPPKRNTVRRSGQLVDPSSMQLPAVGGHGDETDGRGAGNDTFGDSRSGPELGRHLTGPDAAALELQRNHVEPCALIRLTDEQVVASCGARSGRCIGMIQVDQTIRARRALQPDRASRSAASFRQASGIDPCIEELQGRRHGLRASAIRLEIIAQSL